MSRLPKYRGETIAQNIGVVKAARPDFSGFNTLIRGLGDLNADNQQERIAQAKISGSNAVTRDEQGNIVIKPLDLSTDAGRAEAQAAISHYVSAHDNDARKAAAELSGQYKFDPQGFSAVWDAHVSGVINAAPEEYQGRLQSVYEDVGRQTYTSLVTSKNAHDYTLANNAWAERIASKENDVRAFASAGMHGSTEYAQAVSDYEQVLQEGISSRFINEDRAGLMRDRVADEGEALAIAQNALDAYNAVGGGDPGRKAAEEKLVEILSDPNLDIPEARYNRIVETTRQEMNRREACRRGEIQAVQADAKDIETRLQLGFPVDGAKVLDLANRARAAGDDTYANELLSMNTLFTELETFGKMGLADQANMVEAAYMAANDPNSDAGAATRAVALQKAHAAKIQALKDDPFAYGVKAYGREVGMVKDLDLTNLENLSSELQMRASAAEYIQNYDGVPTIPLTNAEIDRLAGIIEVSKPTDQALLLGALADGLGEKYLADVLGKLTGKGDQARTFTVAAGLAQNDFALGRDVLAGDEIRRNIKNTIPSNTLGFRQAVQDYLGGALEKTPLTVPLVMDAALALYAKSSNDVGDISGNLDVDRLERALGRVTGGILEWQGRKIMPPRPGMTQDEFDALIGGLTDDDLGPNPPRSLDGNPVTAQMIKDWGELYSVRDGMYLVQISGWEIGDPLDPTNQSKSWLLDLRDVLIRKPVVDSKSESAMRDYIYQRTGVME